MRPLRPLLLLLSVLAGCQSSLDLGTNPDPVDITGSISKPGSQLSGLKLNLQPVENGLPAAIEIKNDRISAKVTPGKYTWFLSGDEHMLLAKRIPQQFLAGSMDRTLEINGSDTLDLRIE